MLELVIGMLMTMFVFLGASALMLTLFGTSGKVKKSQVVDTTKNDIQIELSNNIRWAKFVNYDANALTVDANIYKFENDGRLYKNGVAMTPDAVTLKNVLIENYSRTVVSGEPLVSLKISLDLEDTRSSNVSDRLTLVVSQRRTRIETGDAL